MSEHERELFRYMYERIKELHGEIEQLKNEMRWTDRRLDRLEDFAVNFTTNDNA